jgi:hydrogenase maturation factor
MNNPLHNKSVEMKYALEAILPGTLDRIEHKCCPVCTLPITEFKNALSEKEYEISGLCQDCQDSIFGE